MEKKDSLIFYISHYQILKNLSDEDFGKLYKAFFENQLGNDVTLPDNLQIPFGLVNNQMVLDSKKYEEKCAKNKENGKKGGRPKKANKANGYFENPNDNENDNDNDNENDNDNDNDNVVVETKETTADLFQFYENSFGRTISSAEYEIINTWEDTELTRYAIKQAELARAFNIRYIQSILADYQKENIKTVAEAEEREKRFKESKTAKNQTYKTIAEKNKEVLANAREKIARGEVK